MSDNLHDKKPFISAQEGWENMEQLLNLYLPVKKTPNKKRHLITYLSASVLCVAFVFISIKLDDVTTPAPHQQNALYIADIQNKSSLAGDNINKNNKQIDLKQRPSISTEKIARTPRTASKGNIINEQEQYATNQTVLRNGSSIASEHILNGQNNLLKIIRMEEQQFVVHAFTPVLLQTLPNAIKVSEISNVKNIEPGQNSSTAISLQKKQQRWGLYAGIAINGSFNSSKQNLLPYPIAEFKYHINRRLFAKVGASVFSPVTAQVSGVDKTVNVNDSSNNILYYNEITNHTHLKYADFPLSIGWQLSKKWSVQTGIQLSVLMSKKTNKTSELLNYQLQNVARQYFVPTTFTAAANTQTYSVIVPKLDCRAITSVRYQFNRIEAGASWQYGLQKSNVQSPVSAGRNQMFSVHALFQLKASKHK